MYKMDMNELDEMELGEIKSAYIEHFNGSVQDYTELLRLYVVVDQHDLIKGYAMGVSYCGRGQGCFWTQEEVYECTLDEWNARRRGGK